MATPQQRNFAAGFPAAMAWLVDGGHLELTQSRAVALAVETCGLRLWPTIRTNKELCKKYGIPLSSLRACRAEVRRILAYGPKQRILAALSKHGGDVKLLEIGAIQRSASQERQQFLAHRDIDEDPSSDFSHEDNPT